MSKFLAFLLVPSVLGLDTSRLQSKESAWEYAKEISAKTTESEQAILKSLLGDRAHWHPEASSLLEEVEVRDTDKWRRLNAGEGRRLSGSQIAGRFYCDGGNKAECEGQSDPQCNPCQWDGFSCDIMKCGGYKNETTCCANAGKVPTGCRWQKGSWSDAMECVANTCEKIIDVKDMTRADMTSKCNAAAGCFAGCATGTNKLVCMAGKEADYDCSCSDTMSSCSAKGASMDLSALSGPSCNLMDCAKCLSGKECSKKKELATKANPGMGDGCKEKCQELTQCDAETDCLFCGPKKATSCTPRVATTPTTCAANPPTVSNAEPACGVACSDAQTRCPSSCSAGGRRLADARRLDFKCYDKNAPAGGAQQGAVITSGAAVVAIIAAMLHCD